MPGPTLGGNSGGSSGGGSGGSNQSGFATSIKGLQQTPDVVPGDFFVIDAPDGTFKLDFADLIIGKDNISFANELSALQTTNNANLTLTNKLTGTLFGTGNTELTVKNLSALNPISAVSGIKIGSIGSIVNRKGIYTFDVPISSTKVFYVSGGNSDQWNSVFTQYNLLSGQVHTLNETMTACSGDWENTHAAVNPNSASWSKAYTQVFSKSATWGGGSSKFTDGGSVTYLTSTSDKLAIGHTTGDSKLSVYGAISASLEIYSATGNSTEWNKTFTTVSSNSSSWGSGGSSSDLSEVAAASADWNYTATNSGAVVYHRVTNNGSGAYRFNGGGFTNDDNPRLFLQRGQRYIFDIDAAGHPFYFKTAQGTGTSNQFTDGVTNNGQQQGNVEFIVPQDAPEHLYYQCSNHSAMHGSVYIDNAAESNSVYTTLNSESADWNSVYTTTKDTSATWGSYSFKTISVSARDTSIPHQSDVIADTSTDTFILCAGPNIELIADSTTDSITISARDAVGSGGGGGGGSSSDLSEVAASSANWNSTYTHYSANSGAVTQTVIQSNSFSVGQAAYIKSDGAYDKAKANDADTADVVGLIEVASGSQFTIVYAGEFTKASHGFTVGAAVYLSSDTAGALTETAPSAEGTISKPVGVVKDANTIIVQTYRGIQNQASGSSGGSGGGHVIQKDSVSQTQRDNLNFVSTGGTTDLKVEDNGSDTTSITFPNSFDLMMIGDVFR